MKFPRTWLLPIITILLGACGALLLIPIENAAVAEQLGGFPDSHFLTHHLRLYILAFLCFLPAIAAIAYSLGNTFDRYLARQFISIFLISLAALFAIWLLLDLNDNLGDFEGAKNLITSVLYFYLFRAPAILMVILPYSLLLALIYALGKFSKSNEIIAIIQSGTSIVRVSLPLVFAGIWCSIFLLCLNYHWAPHAEGMREELVAAAKDKPIIEASNVLYRDPNSRRIWMVGAFPKNFQLGEALRDVEITTMALDQTIQTRLTTPRASYNRKNRSWTLEKPLIATFTTGQSPDFQQMEKDLVRKKWSETPTQIIKPGLPVEYLGIPELTTWLISPLASQAISDTPAYLTHWHYRWALPLTCIVTVLLAAPLSIHFARRGSGSGVFVAIVLSVAMIFISSITLALGEASILPPWLAAWFPNIVFTLIGLWLFHRRITGRPIYQTVRKILTPQT